MGISFSTAKLLDYADRIVVLQASHNPFAWVTLAHLRTRQAHHDPELLYAAKWELTRQLFMHAVIRCDQLDDGYWRAIVQLEKERKMKWISPLEQSFIDKGVQQGLLQGLEQGLQKGRKEGAAALLERLLIRRFGPLPQTVRNKLAKADVARIEAWSDALPEAQSLKQVFG